MKLWTIQDNLWKQTLERDGLIHGTDDFVREAWESDSGFLNSYSWIKTKIPGNKPDIPNISPIWGWYQWLGEKKKKPDLRFSGFGTKGKEMWLFEIEKDPSEVLLSDFDTWHLCLMEHYISESEEDDLRFDEKLKAVGWDYSKTFSEIQDLSLKQEIYSSWDRILDLDCNNPWVSSKREDKSIQACFWLLKIDEIKSIKKFISR